MTRRKIELDVDFIGGQEGLTKEEEEALSDFFKNVSRLLNNGQLKMELRP